MKYLLPFLLFSAWLQTAAQNVVPNGDFESYTQCPTGLSQMNRATGWRAYTGGSSDYFNSCATGAVSVPGNLIGFQNAASGNAYAGVITYTHNTSGGNNYKEYIATTIPALQVGVPYEISMSVSLADTANWAANDLGMFLYDSGPNTVSGSGVLNVTPQVSFSSYGNITNKTNWTRVSAIFIADSTYDNIVIGGFTHTSLVSPTAVTGGSGGNAIYSYYYIDSVVIKTVDTLRPYLTSNMFCGTDSFLVSYYAHPVYFSSGNVFTVQLSDASGSFASPINIGSKAATTSGTIKVGLPASLTPGSGYRIRMVSTNTAFVSPDNGTNISIGMTPPVKPVATSNSTVCSGNTLNLSATTTGTVTSWLWTGPNNFSSTSSTASFSNATPSLSGSYIVKAFYYGCVSSDTEIVSVVQAPAAIIAGSNSPVCSGDTLKLTASVSTTGTAYTWNGPNSFTATTRNADITPASVNYNGDFVVTGTLNGCQVKDTVTVVVYAQPAGVLATGTSPVCETDTIKLYATSTTPGVSYSWSGPSGFNTTIQDPQIFSASGLNTGNYIVTVSNGICLTKDTVHVQVKPLPTPVIAGNNGPVCDGSSVSLSVPTGLTGTTFTWAGPGSYSSTTQNPSLTVSPTSAGDYIVTANYNGCIKKDTTTVVVKPVPVATAASSGAACEGQQISLTGSSTLVGSSFNWTGPASFSSTLQNPVLSPVTAAQNGTYNLTAMLNGCTSAAATVNVTVYAIPATPTANSNIPVCAGGALNLTANSITSGVNYSWTGPNNFASTAQNPTISPVPLNAAGVYNVTADANGCVSPAGSVTVSINNVSSLGVYPSPNDTLCINNTNASFVAVPFNAGTAPQYQWYKNNSPIGGATNISYPATGIADGDSFYCRMTVTGLCADPLILYSNKLGMTVLPLSSGPSVSITADPGTLLSPWQLVKFTAVATNAGAMPKYQWKRNSQDVIGANSNVWSANNLSNGDTIGCVVISDIWCATPSTAASNRMVVNIKLGVDDIEGSGRLGLYPNPNNGSFTVNIPLTPFKGGNLRVDIVDALGRTVYRSTVNQSSFEIALPASVANGVYMLKLSADGVMYHARFTVSR